MVDNKNFEPWPFLKIHDAQAKNEHNEWVLSFDEDGTSGYLATPNDAVKKP